MEAAATVGSIIGVGMSILGLLIPLIIGLGLVYFIWGLVQFIGKAGDEAGRTEGKAKMLWGIIAIFVIVSVWGLVGILRESFFGGGADKTPPPPQFQS
ncbi:MAG TPA: hypothetical protein VJB98_04130 [Candidatus Paceibacterota bacterium]